MKNINKIFNRDNWQVLLVILIIAGAIGLSRVFVNSRAVLQTSVQAARLPVTIVELAVGAHRVEIRTTGRVMPRSTVSITPQVSGRVEWVGEDLYSGGYLLRDEVLFRIEAADYENDMARESAAVAKARTEVALEQAEAGAAVAEWQALNEGVTASPLVSHEPQIAQTQAELASAQARLAQAQLNLSRTQYRLPFDGRVISSTLELGEYVLAGREYGEIYNQDSLEIVLSLPQAELPWISNRDEVDVVINFDDPGSGSGRKSVAGQILRIAAILDDATRFQQVIVKPIGDGSLLPGMLTEVVLSSAPIANTWELPVAALQHGQLVWLVDEDSILHSTVPEIIATMSESVIARLPGTMRSIRVVDTMISGAIEGSEVVVLNVGKEETRRDE
ncbi:MAG: hypothetical protein DRR06_13770 [Gammaproteobacteria bacterium]|nr:MAG: hypothetical protein DRR06_13770 [Gammaproteobacteria bacterium]